MTTIIQAAIIAAKLAQTALDALERNHMASGQRASLSETIRCAGCNEEAWVIRYGAIRVGQDLTGWYAQATTHGEPVLLCRGCWHRSIGVDDYSAPNASTLAGEP